MTGHAESDVSPMSRRISFWVLIVIILLVGVVFYRVMANFLLPLFLAVLLVVIFQPLYEWLLTHCKQRRHVAATLATIVVVLVVFLPTVFVISVATSETISIAKRFDARRITTKLGEIRTKWGLELPLDVEIRDINQSFAKLEAYAREPFDRVGVSSTKFDPATARGAIADLRQKLAAFQDKVTALPPGSFKGDCQNGDLIAAAIEAEQSPLDSSSQFQQSVKNLAYHWDECKVRLMGSLLHVRTKELANPSTDDLHQWRDLLLDQLNSSVLPVTRAGAGLIGQLLFGTIIMLVSVFFFFVDGPTMIAAMMRMTPLDIRHQRVLLYEFANISRAVVLATMLSAITQGLLAGIGFWFAGIPSVAFLILATTVLAMIPFVGAVSVWLPVCLWLFVMEGETKTAMVLAVYCAVIVSQSDNVVKPLILRGKSKLHPLLALLSILGGVQALGPIGILVGPMVVTFLTTLLNILHRELAGEPHVALPEAAGTAAIQDRSKTSG